MASKLIALASRFLCHTVPENAKAMPGLPRARLIISAQDSMETSFLVQDRKVLKALGKSSRIEWIKLKTVAPC